MGYLMEGVRWSISTRASFAAARIGSDHPAALSRAPPSCRRQLMRCSRLWMPWKNFLAPSDLPQLARRRSNPTRVRGHPSFPGRERPGGTLVAILLLIEWGLISQPLLYLSAFFEAHRLDYYERLLAVSRRGEWENWLLFFLQGGEQPIFGCHHPHRAPWAIAGSLPGAPACSERAAGRLLQTLDVLFERPILNIRQLEAALDVPYRTAQGMLKGWRKSVF